MNNIQRDVQKPAMPLLRATEVTLLLAVMGCSDGANLGTNALTDQPTGSTSGGTQSVGNGGAADANATGGNSSNNGGQIGTIVDGGAAGAVVEASGGTASGGTASGGAASGGAASGGAASGGKTGLGGQSPAAAGQAGATLGIGGDPNGQVTLTAAVDRATLYATWHNDTDQSIYLRGCGTVDFWRQNAGAWLNMGAVVMCDQQAAAVEVPARTAYRDPSGVVTTDFIGPFRFTGDYGAGCLRNVPLSAAACSSVQSATSNQVLP